MPSMTTALEQRAASRVAPIGLLFLVTASVGWGLNWPVMKFVFSEWPPLSARGWAGVIGAAALALYAVATGVSLKVPADQWPRLIISAILNVALWVAVMSYALLWLPASEAVVIAYTMPVWTALLANLPPMPPPGTPPTTAPLTDSGGPVFWAPLLALTALTFFRLPEALLLLRLQDTGVAVATIPLVWAGLHVVRSASSYPGGWLTDRSQR